MTQNSLFQGPIYPNATSGELPTQEGIVIFPQTLIGLGPGLFAVSSPIFARVGYFFEFWFNSFVEPAGQMFARAYPSGTTPDQFGSFLAGKADFGLSLNNLNQPSKIAIPPNWPIVHIWLNGGVGQKAFTSLVGLHLKDCSTNNRKSI